MGLYIRGPGMKDTYNCGYENWEGGKRRLWYFVRRSKHEKIIFD